MCHLHTTWINADRTDLTTCSIGAQLSSQAENALRSISADVPKQPGPPRTGRPARTAPRVRARDALRPVYFDFDRCRNFQFPPAQLALDPVAGECLWVILFVCRRSIAPGPRLVNAEFTEVNELSEAVAARSATQSRPVDRMRRYRKLLIKTSKSTYLASSMKLALRNERAGGRRPRARRADYAPRFVYSVEMD
ncbi:hypothetical protein EVAR_24730_1 [Eumeta japonica]|uniref:Uncharacterized protein n=1 Tax=Eumeta variegata TaxID=151549 RepID=A0A4C1VEQ9_EUMVA|nr:hypothetical protein EVAR_24730_1 [Eumeta japonica]